MEIWKRVNGYTEYEISSRGRVRKNGNIAKCSIDRINGYVKCGLYIDGKTIIKAVHRMVAEAFIENPENKPQVHHINDDRTDNRVENLMWVTPKEHGQLQSNESKRKMRETYRKNRVLREKKKSVHTNAH